MMIEVLIVAFLVLAIAVMVYGAVMGFLCYRTMTRATAALGQANREMLGSLVARQVNDPRVSAMAVKHLTDRDTMAVAAAEPAAVAVESLGGVRVRPATV